MSLSFEEWFDNNEEALSIECAETGADRELDFDFENFCEHRYSKWLDKNKKENENEN